MNGGLYFKKSREVAKNLNNSFASFLTEHPRYMGVVDDYVHKNVHLNGSQFVAGFEAAKSEKNLDSYLRVPILLEHVMLKAYKTNRILDEKHGVWDNKYGLKEIVAQDCYMSSLLEDLRVDVLQKLNSSERDFVEGTFSKIVSKISHGLQIEQETLNARYVDLDMILPNWKTNYTLRNLYYNLVYDFSPLVGYGLAKRNYDIVAAYEDAFPLDLRFSAAGQVINDYSDFHKLHDGKVKHQSDQYADLRLGLITYPVHALLHTFEIKSALKNPEITFDFDWQTSMTQILLKSNVVDSIKADALLSYQKHEQFWQEQGLKDVFLLGTYGILTSSKYLK